MDGLILALLCDMMTSAELNARSPAVDEAGIQKICFANIDIVGSNPFCNFQNNNGLSMWSYETVCFSIFICRYSSIRLSTKFLRFFQKFSFSFSTPRVQLAFNYVCTTTIYDLLATLWQGQDPAFVEVLRLLTEEFDDFHFDVVLVGELFLAQMVRKRTKQMVVR